jgi:REP element-mobilizing transposase RayT
MRVEYPGAIYHVMDRWDRREDIFLDEVDRQELLKTLAEGCQRTGWQVLASCLRRNHFHVVLETPNANLVAGMRWFLSAYTIRNSSATWRRAVRRKTTKRPCDFFEHNKTHNKRNAV